MKTLMLLMAAALVLAGAAALYAGPGACTWVQKSKYHGNAGEPNAYCTCGHFWDDHK